MYSVSQKKNKIKKNKLGSYDLISLDGFVMSSKKGFKVNNQVIRNIKVVDQDIAHILVYNKVKHNYSALINLLTELLTSDDDSGEALREALNHIEKFRLEIKNKYREYLKRKELEMMSKELVLLKKEAEKRLIELNENIKNLSSGKSR